MNNLCSEAVAKHKQLISNAFNYLWSHPESGYREWQTSSYLENAFNELGYKITKPNDIPGFYTVFDTGKPGPEILILGELDALICPEHPEADKITGAVHCCGHCAQTASLLGIAAALRDPAVTDGLCGKIRLCAVPAEELIELEYRASLIDRGIIKFRGGKTEFLSRGYFDGADIAILVHTTTESSFFACDSYVGCITKQAIYTGVAAHAGASPHKGKNALYAATLGLSAINSVRETFKDSDMIRVHPIITNGGSSVNAIPDKVIIESYIRGRSFDAIKEANDRVNRALCGAALSLGAGIEICDLPGYAPLTNLPSLLNIADKAAHSLGFEFEIEDNTNAGCSDMGDLSCVMPVIAVNAPGAVGFGHSPDYYFPDPAGSCIDSAAWQLQMLRILLSNNGAEAKDIISKHTPLFASKDEYLKYLDTFSITGERISYKSESATVRL